MVKNYRPVGLLPIFGKMLERIIYNSHFTPSQSRFLPGDSCIAQLLSVIHKIQTAFDGNPTVDIRRVVLDISTVWHDGIIFKLKAYSI